MCGILFTNKDISDFDIEHVLKFLKHRGPDYTSIKKIKDYSFIHTLLSMTGPLTEQPFYSKDENIICMFNGEIYNFDEFGDYHSDGECLIPLYEEYGTNFINNLDGEFAIVLVDIKKQILIYSTDIFGTRPLWIGFDGNEFGISTYKSCLERIGIKNSHQVLSNQTNIFDLNQLKLIATNRVHSFDLTQHKTNFDDWTNMLRINTLAPLKIVESFLKQVKNSEKKVIVSISSLLGSISANDSGGQYAYRSSKSALNSVNKSLSIDLADKGIISIVISPGWARTDMGGPNATVDPVDSVSGIREVINNLKLEDNGKFFNFDGSIINW